MSIHRQTIRKLAAVLTCGILFFLLSGFSSTGTKYYEGFKYEVISKSKKTCKIIDYIGSDETLTVPSKMDGYTVVTIGESAFLNSTKLKTLSLPNSITTIEEDAFCYCPSLSSVTLPTKLTAISDSAFAYCKSLATINLPSGLKTIGEKAFSGCSSLTSIKLPSCIKSIGTAAFSDCSSLTSIKLQSGITTIENSAFSRCSSLASVKLPSSITSIGTHAFSGCSSLASVKLPSSITSIGSYAFSGCSSLATINLPDSIISIGSYAFSDCSLLTSVTIPSKMQTIEEKTFYQSGLAEVVVPGNIRTIGDYAFNNCANLKNVIIMNGTQSIGSLAFYSCDNLEYISVPSSVTESDYFVSSKVKVHGFEGSYIAEELGDSSHYSNHAFTETVVAPTCAKGYTEYSCECGYFYRENYVKATKKHTTVKIEAVKATTSKAGNTAGSYCSSCHTVFEESQAVAQIKSVTLSAEKFVYNGKTKKPTVEVTDANGDTISSSYYTVKYPSKSVDVGKYTVKITFKGKYSGTETLTYQIIPKGTSFTKITRVNSGIKLQLSKQTTKTSGYRIQYARKKDFSNAKTIMITNNKTLVKTIKDLAVGKTYYLRVQTYKNVKIAGKTQKIYSAWSETAKVVVAKSIGKFYKQYEKIPFLVSQIGSNSKYDVMYTMPTAHSTQVNFGMRITKDYPGYYPYQVTFYRATSKDGTYKKVSGQTNNWYNKYFVVYDDDLASNKKYYYKAVILYVPNACDSKAEFNKLPAAEKIYDETIAIESFYTAMAPMRDLKTDGWTMTWSAKKGAAGYIIREFVSRKLGYNIFGNPVFSHASAENISKTNSVRSRIKTINSGFSGKTITYHVSPYVKHGSYYYCHGKPVAKKIEHTTKISFN